MNCEFVIPEHTYPTHSEIRFIDDDHVKTERIVHTDTDPEHLCDRPATRKAVSLQERNDGSFQEIRTKYYCDLHFLPGEITKQDGSVTEHPEQALDD